jgi:RecA/RadA recombinase
MREQAQNDLGQEVSIGSEPESMLVGLPLPALCLRYLFQSTTFPLSRITQITGEEGSAKSAFLYEMFRWHMVYGGGAVLAENENKDSPELRHSLLQWHDPYLARLIVTSTHALEEWQDVFTKFIDMGRKRQDDKTGPGRTVPIIFGVDSLMATAPQSEIDAVNRDGHASRGYALAANLIARYMRTMPERIKRYPFSVVGTNHLKPGTDARGLPTSTVPGGKAVKFMETFEIEMRRAAQCDIDRLEYGGLRLKLIAKKNSLGPSRKMITAEMLWWYADDGNGTFRQQTAWDWDAATIELLLSFENAKGKKTIYKRLMDICDVKVSKSNRVAWSKTLGIDQADAAPYRVVGAALEQRPDLLNQMYQVLGITPRRPFQPGVDYRDLLETAKDEASAAADDLYADVENLPELEMDRDEALTPEVDQSELGLTSEEQAVADGTVGEDDEVATVANGAPPSIPEEGAVT